MFYFILIQQLGSVTRIVSDIVNCPVLIVSLRELIMCGMGGSSPNSEPSISYIFQDPNRVCPERNYS
jgi:hypothetical protein